MSTSGKRFTLICLAFCLAACQTVAQLRRGPFREKPISVRSFDLANGLRVVAEADTGSPMVGVALTVGVGFSADPIGREDLAHLVEHLGFRATLRNGFTVGEAFEYAGAAEFNAVTSPETTSFVVRGPRDALPAFIAGMARILEGPHDVPAEIIDVERRIIEAEHGLKSESLRRKAELHGLLFPARSPAVRVVGATGHSVRDLSAGDVRGFVKAHYRPSSATVAVTGGVSPVELERALDNFRSVGTSAVHERMHWERTEPLEPPPGKLKRIALPAFHETLSIAYAIPNAYSTPGVLRRLEQLVDVWASSLSRENDSIGEVSVQAIATSQFATLVCDVTLKIGANPDAVFDFITARLEERARNFDGDGVSAVLPRQWYPSLLDVGERALARAERAQVADTFLFNAGKPVSVQNSDVKRELKWFDRRRARALYVKPTDRSGTLQGSQVENESLPSQRSDKIRFSREAVTAVARKMNTQAAGVERLDNGLRIVALPSTQFAEVGVVLLWPGGHALAEPPGAMDLEWLAWPKVVGLGTPETVGAHATRSIRADGLAYQLMGHKDNLEPMLGWLAYLTGAAWEVDSLVLGFATSALESSDRESAESVRIMRGIREFRATLWRGHPYGRAATSSDLRALSDGEIESWMERAHSPGGAVLVIVGDVDPAVVLAMARRLFGPLRPHRPVEVPPLRGPSGRAVQVVTADAPGMDDVALAWGCHIGAEQPRDAAVARLAARWLDFKMKQTLRERSGTLYLVNVADERWRGGFGTLGAVSSVAKGQLGQVLRSWAQALEAEVTPTEVLSATWDSLRARNGHLELPEGLALEVARRVRDGWPVSSIDEEPEMMASIPPQDVARAVESCRANQTFLLVGDEAAIRAGLGAAGLRP